MISHEGVFGHAGPGHVADGPLGQSSDGGKVAEREGQNHSQAPDTDNDPQSGFSRQTRLHRVDDRHVPTTESPQLSE